MAKDRSLAYSDGISEIINADTEVKEFIAGGAITTGQWVALDTTPAVADQEPRYVVPLPAATTAASIAVGVALEAAAAGAIVRVATAGFVCNGLIGPAATSYSIAPGNLLMPHGATAGAATLWAYTVTVPSGTTVTTTITVAIPYYVGVPLGIATETVAIGTTTAAEVDVLVYKKF